MNVNFRRALGGTFVLALASAVTLPGCANKETHTLEKAGAAADKAIEKAKDATVEAAKSVSEAADKVKETAAAAATSVGRAADKAVDETKQAAAKYGAAAEKGLVKANESAKAASTGVAPKK